MQSSSSRDEYFLLKNHSKPPPPFAFPTTYLGGCNFVIRHNWLDDHQWVAYSTKVNGAFCVPCALFSSDCIKAQLVTKPFQAWKKKSEKC